MEITIQIVGTGKISAVFHVTHIKHRTIILVSEEKGAEQEKPCKLEGQITSVCCVEHHTLLQTRGRSVRQTT